MISEALKEAADKLAGIKPNREPFASSLIESALPLVELYEQVVEYAQHKSDCDARKPYLKGDPPPDCSCGLDTLLSEIDEARG